MPCSGRRQPVSISRRSSRNQGANGSSRAPPAACSSTRRRRSGLGLREIDAERLLADRRDTALQRRAHGGACASAAAPHRPASAEPSSSICARSRRRPGARRNARPAAAAFAPLRLPLATTGEQRSRQPSNWNCASRRRRPRQCARSSQALRSPRGDVGGTAGAAEFERRPGQAKHLFPPARSIRPAPSFRRPSHAGRPASPASSRPTGSWPSVGLALPGDVRRGAVRGLNSACLSPMLRRRHAHAATQRRDQVGRMSPNMSP